MKTSGIEFRRLFARSSVAISMGVAAASCGHRQLEREFEAREDVSVGATKEFCYSGHTLERTAVPSAFSIGPGTRVRIVEEVTTIKGPTPCVEIAVEDGRRERIRWYPWKHRRLR